MIRCHERILFVVSASAIRYPVLRLPRAKDEACGSSIQCINWQILMDNTTAEGGLEKKKINGGKKSPNFQLSLMTVLEGQNIPVNYSSH